MYLHYFFDLSKTISHEFTPAIVSWDSIQITMYVVKSQIQKTFTSEIWKGFDYQSLIALFLKKLCKKYHVYNV